MQAGDMVRYRLYLGDVGIIIAVVEKHFPVAENKLCKVFWVNGITNNRWDDELEIIK
jgi:hypothetical protein